MMKSASLAIACFVLAASSAAPSAAKADRAGAKTASARTSVSKDQPKARPDKRPDRNVIVNDRDAVIIRPGPGYYDNGNYHHNDWDDDDNEFIEFVGKTAAITAGISVVSAVIGSIVEDQPEGCQPVVAYGTNYLYCNGTYYVQVSQNGTTAYQVVAPPPAPPQ
jgi:hypothetical protein